MHQNRTLCIIVIYQLVRNVSQFYGNSIHLVEFRHFYKENSFLDFFFAFLF